MGPGINRNAFVKCFLSISTAVLLLVGAVSQCLPDDPAKIIILPFTVVPCSDEAELRAFSDHLDETIRSAIGLLSGNYSIQSRDTVEELLKGRPSPSSDREARTTGKDFGSDFVVYGFLSGEDAGYRMRGVMWDVNNHRVMVSTDLKVGNIHALPGILQFFINGLIKRLEGSPSLPFYQTQSSSSPGTTQTGRLRTVVNMSRSEGPWRSQDISGTLSGLAIGDVAGDKRNETIFVGGGGITINRFEDARLRSLTHFAQSPAVYLTAQAADLDGDGVDELIVCYQAPTGVVSQIIRYVNRNLELSQSFQNVILAAINDSEDERGKILVGQRTDVDDMFRGEMVRFKMQDGKAVADGSIDLPIGTLLLSYASGRLGDGNESLKIILNQEQRLMVFDKENRQMSVVNDRLYGLNRSIRVASTKGMRDILWPGRILISDAGGDGSKELLVIKNFDGKSEIHSLNWDGAHLMKKWNTSTFDGVISDFFIDDFKNNGNKSLVFLLVKSDPFLAFSGPRSVVFAYDFIP